MNQRMLFSAVIFDMDGLMLDTERLARRAWEQAMAEWGYVIPETLYLKVVGQTTRSTQKIFQESFGPDLPIEAITERSHYLETAMAQKGIPIKPGLLELLDQLEQWEIHKAVGSSSSRRFVLHKLTQVGLAHRFEVIVGGDEVLHGKPEPDIFLAVAHRLQVPAETCIVLEDSEAGVKAAYTAGMVPLMVPDLKPPTSEIRQLANRIFPSLHEVRGFLRQLGGVTA
ncbi:MAG: HAD family phosphatase [Candidatus Tectomicrobia bacterium]|uniref:HAD family phosphatase n=1 Tax=Tectimicrobiota bacterium TaxID=2528274 RepID=A0A933GNE3_UNCTE|nr:HAD family phosphatase [Candidatus Tectomicrobia bacterium]